ncbi:MAG: hypothetical protein K0S34_91 [Bacillales bacterium]|nr:hypothetical protein [Bacillales bacterium]
MKQIPYKSEKVINEILHTEAIPMAIQSIQPNIPVSTWKNKVRKKKHAKENHPQAPQKENLGFTIRPKPRFNYLKYPDLAIGTSQHNVPQYFMKKGLQDVAPKIIDKLMDGLQEEIYKTLGG